MWREQKARLRLHKLEGALVGQRKEFLSAEPAGRGVVKGGIPHHVANPRVRMENGGERRDIVLSIRAVVAPRLQHARFVHGPQLVHRRTHLQLRVEEDGPLAREEDVRRELRKLREQPQRDVQRRGRANIGQVNKRSLGGRQAYHAGADEGKGAARVRAARRNEERVRSHDVHRRVRDA